MLGPISPIREKGDWPKNPFREKGDGSKNLGRRETAKKFREKGDSICNKCSNNCFTKLLEFEGELSTLAFFRSVRSDEEAGQELRKEVPLEVFGVRI